jgi:hypothetical protein
MKNSKKNFVAIFAVAMIALISIAYSNERPNREQFDDLRDQIKEYADQNIIPKLTEWKAQFDAKLSSEDLSKLNSLRAQAEEHRQNTKSQIRQHLQDGSGEGRNRQDRRKDRQQNREVMENIFDQLEPIAEKYEKDIDAIAEKAEPFRDKWQEDIRNIHDTWMEQHEDELKQGKGRRGGRGMRGMGGGFMGMGLCPEGDNYRFLLWDGSQEGFENDNSFGAGFKSESGKYDRGSRNHPNPFSDNTTISFYLPKDENVQLYVFDSDGKLVQTLCNEELSAGEHSFEFKPQDNASGTFFYNLKSESLNKTGKMILSK